MVCFYVSASDTTPHLHRSLKFPLCLCWSISHPYRRVCDCVYPPKPRAVEQFPLNSPSTEQLRAIIKEYYDHAAQIESDKYDVELEIIRKDYEINELNIQVNDLRGKFIKPTLKKVSKYENKFAKLQKKAAEFNFRNQLKTVKKKEFELEDDKGATKPDWAAGGPGATKKEGEEGEAPTEGDGPAAEEVAA